MFGHELRIGSANPRVKLHGATKNNNKNNSVRRQKKQKANRRNGAMKSTSGLTANRTFETLQKSLIRGIPRSGPSSMSDYVHCRVNPFSGSGRTGIPDGGNDQFIVTDMFTFDTISLNGNNNFSIQTMPTLPTGAVITYFPTASTPAMIVNGQSYPAPASFSGGTINTQGGGLYPLSIGQAYLSYVGNVQNSYFPGAPAIDPYSAVTMRMVAKAYRLTYTGPMFDCSGSITITPNKCTMVPVGTIGILAAANQTVLNVYGPAGAINNGAQGGTDCLSANVYLSSTAYTKDSITVRPEQGVLFIPKHMSNDFKNVALTDRPYGVLNNSMPVANALTATANFYTNFINAQTNSTAAGGVLGQVNGGVVWYDNDWSDVIINGNGINGDATFRWETVYCMEVKPSSGAILSNMTRKQTPEALNQIKLAQKITNDMPIAMPLDPR